MKVPAGTEVPLKFEGLVADAVQGGGGGVDEQFRLLGEKLISTMEPELVSVADPEIEQLPERLQVPDAGSVALPEPSAVNVMLPGTVVVPLSQVAVKV